MPSGRSFYQRSPERYAVQKQEFRQLVAELKRSIEKRILARTDRFRDRSHRNDHQSMVHRILVDPKARQYRAAENLSGDSLRPRFFLLCARSHCRNSSSQSRLHRLRNLRLPGLDFRNKAALSMNAPKREPTLAFFSSECFQVMPFADGLRIAHSFGELA
jgi:hypothetical protein